MGLRRNLFVGGFLTLVILGGLLAAFALSLTPGGRVILVLFVGLLLTIGFVAAGFVWWVRQEIGPNGPSEEVQKRVERRVNDDDG
jgi:cytochrome c biogenesis protein CcdA